MHLQSPIVTVRRLTKAGAWSKTRQDKRLHLFQPAKQPPGPLTDVRQLELHEASMHVQKQALLAPSSLHLVMT